MTVKEYSGTLSNSAFALPENVARREIIFSNLSDTVMSVRFGGGTATAAIGVVLPAGSALRFEGKDADGRPLYWQAVSLFCAGATKAYTIYEA